MSRYTGPIHKWASWQSEKFWVLPTGQHFCKKQTHINIFQKICKPFPYSFFCLFSCFALSKCNFNGLEKDYSDQKFALSMVAIKAKAAWWCLWINCSQVNYTASPKMGNQIFVNGVDNHGLMRTLCRAKDPRCVFAIQVNTGFHSHDATVKKAVS